MKNKLSLLVGIVIGMAMTIGVTVVSLSDTASMKENDLMAVFENGYACGRLREVTGVNNYTKDSAYVSNIWFNE